MSHPSLSLSRESCTCGTCQSWCEHVPGWFLPGEAEHAAALLNLSLADFFRQYLTVDYWMGEADRFTLRPATTDETPGGMAPIDPRGQCVFYRDQQCAIHAAKPHECAIAVCSREIPDGTHEATGAAWEPHQVQIATLLGEPPVTPEASFDDLFSLLLP